MFLEPSGHSSPGSPKNRGAVVAAAFLSISLAAAAFAAGPRFSVFTFTVNSLPAFPVALAENGIYAGNYNEGTAQAVVYHPFYTENNSFHPIPTLAEPADDAETTSLATGVNNSGHVVGTSYLDPVGPVRHAWLYKDGNVRDLSDVLETTYSQANAINNNGWIVVVSSNNNPFFGRAFLLKTGANDVLIDLGPGAAYGISENGYVVGETTGENDTGRVPFVFKDTDNDNIVDAGELVKLTLFQGTTVGRANAVNDSGRVVGECQPGGGTVVGCMWATPTANAVPTSLGHINAQAPQTIPRSINNANQVVGLSGGLAFLWETNAIKYLGSLVPVQQGQATWSTYAALAINNTGWIAGSGVPLNTQVEHGFILKPNSTPPPPPPPTVLLKVFKLHTTSVILINKPVPARYSYLFSQAPSPATPFLVTVTKDGSTEPAITIPASTTKRSKIDVFPVPLETEPGNYTVSFIHGDTKISRTLTIKKMQATLVTVPPTVQAGKRFTVSVKLNMPPARGAAKVPVPVTIQRGERSYVVTVLISPGRTLGQKPFTIPAGPNGEGTWTVTANLGGTVQTTTEVTP